MTDDYHNIHAKKVPTKLITSCAIHMASCLVDIQQIPAVLHPPGMSIHRPAEVKVKGEIVICYSAIDEQVMRNKMQQALVNMRKTFLTQLPPVMLKLDPKRLKESLRPLMRLERAFTSRGDWFRVNAIPITVRHKIDRTGNERCKFTINLS